MVKRALIALLALAVLLAAALAVNTLGQRSRQIDVPALAPVAVDEAAAGASLAAAVRTKTISDYFDPDRNAAEFDALHAHLQARYPRVHATLKRELVNGKSLLYTWQGSDANAKPIALMAHQDVVPIAPGTESLWTVPPFEGRLKDGFVWGRGAWDDKGNLIAEMEAVEMLLATGFSPKRTVYLIFGADEEVGGQRGAAKIAALLAERKQRLEFVLDEGLLIVEGAMPGLNKPVALIGLSEKGYLSVQLKAQAVPGHSSMPPPAGTSAIALMSRALSRLDEHQMPGAISGVARSLFDTVAPEMEGFNKVALSNLWLLGPIVKSQLEKGPSTNALLRTTTALTVVQAGNKDNVLPGEAQAIVNFRILPGDTQQSVLTHVKEAIADERIGITPLAAGSAEPSPVSSTESASYRTIARTVRELFPGTVVAPGLMIGATDSHLFADVADNIYRFSPVKARPEDLPRFHGTNERIALANLADLIRFYHRLLQQSAGPTAATEGPKP